MFLFLLSPNGDPPVSGAVLNGFGFWGVNMLNTSVVVVFICSLILRCAVSTLNARFLESVDVCARRVGV